MLLFAKNSSLLLIRPFWYSAFWVFIQNPVWQKTKTKTVAVKPTKPNRKPRTLYRLKCGYSIDRRSSPDLIYLCLCCIYEVLFARFKQVFLEVSFASSSEKHWRILKPQLVWVWVFATPHSAIPLVSLYYLVFLYLTSAIISYLRLP